MFGRRDKHSGPQALSRRGRGSVCASLCLLLAGLTLAAAGDDDALSTDGVVHEIRVAAGPSGATMLVYTRQLATGEISTEIVEGTDDHTPDSNARIDVTPKGEPVIVWSRTEGTGPQLYASRRGPSGWLPRVSLFEGPQEKVDALVNARGSWIQVTWKEIRPAAVDVYRAVLDPLTLEPVFGPELLPGGDGTVPVGLAGDPAPGTTPEPPLGSTLSPSVLAPSTPGDPGQIVVWGIEDEPIPIDYCQRFRLPGSVWDVHDLQAGFVADRAVVSYRSGTDFYYTIRQDGMWTDLRVIKLDDEAGVDTARLEVIEMILRGVGPE